MLGIQEIGIHIPEKRISNFAFKEKFELDDKFIEEKLGIRAVAIKEDSEEASHLCVKAMKRLVERCQFDPSKVECVVVVTQNPDSNIPHVSAILHGTLGLPEPCACFDISLGCSGYVYGLAVVLALMAQNGFTNGLLFTADPYSKIVNRDDKNTALLFGDAGTVTLVSDKPRYRAGKFNFGTLGREHKELICNRSLHMNGRAIYNFAARYVPADVRLLLKKHGLELGHVDKLIFHQASKYVVDTLIKLLGVDKCKVPFDATDYGNTVSSSIPIILEKELHAMTAQRILISGFGAGLSWASTILERV